MSIATSDHLFRQPHTSAYSPQIDEAVAFVCFRTIALQNFASVYTPSSTSAQVPALVRRAKTLTRQGAPRFHRPLSLSSSRTHLDQPSSSPSPSTFQRAKAQGSITRIQKTYKGGLIKRKNFTHEQSAVFIDLGGAGRPRSSSQRARDRSPDPSSSLAIALPLRFGPLLSRLLHCQCWKIIVTSEFVISFKSSNVFPHSTWRAHVHPRCVPERLCTHRTNSIRMD
ncbi:hypothetical protein BD410DRAFT_289241 [Rickenella mellea]|uniref:Uncharacterized protein n=1 Tax=Rickenella mellea TaxID=50990 RepID=A0A4Y7Q337_9AGAM|nr:hypothetical protein BD410DRAFT_289241 [Rickenella mellea]